ncbi:MAG: Spermidine/putrescine import ATP-binding protein PotA [Chlamydiia bacterium]|nr:Spermidine/putrescine import ATP-binding protein PotA [Chlamydiia bacterium]MCH9615867.1 Spermidine/putrescine import ATP-binding protein PotA [Chlamydiia bacterium]MCH9628730.1 Spermidine/putrescine import ATP-binding protein PotA [Chlamydiia bacterium]
MKSISIKNVSKSSSDGQILSNLSLDIPAGKFFALLGPSGCGKTTLLRLIAGLDPLEAGAVYLGDADITGLPANKRNINIVFQNYALFPHLTVYQNIAYPLAIRKFPKDVIDERVERMLRAFHIEKHAHKFPSQLSGGQQQRVAIARATVNEPEVLLLDEPLAALDFKLREKLLVELIDLQDKLQTTFIYVTHDQFEALAVADIMAIMNNEGEIEQIGTPEEIYEFPNSSFVAKFVGSTNLFKGHIEGDTFVTEKFGTFQIAQKLIKEQATLMSIRPEKILISKEPVENFSNTMQGIIRDIVYQGRSTQYNVLVDDVLIQVFDQNEVHFPQDELDYDDVVNLYWQKSNVVLLEE